MDELQISGKRFISSRRLARDNGYTADYLGQLIRGGKVVGQKVGRAWYVDAASFDAYLGAEGPTPVVVEVEEEEVAPAPVAPVEVSLAAPAPVVIKEEPVEEIKPVVEVPIIATKQEEPVYRVPLHIIKKEEPAAEKKEAVTGGLRYFADDGPSLPPIRLATKSTQVTPSAAPEATEEKVFVVKNTLRSSKVPVFALAGIAVAVFGVSAFLASAVALNLNIETGNTASVSYSLPW